MKKIKNSKIPAIEYLFIVFIVIVYASVVIYFLLEFGKKKTEYIVAKEEKFEKSITDILENYEKFSEFIFKSEINKKSVLEIVKKAEESDETIKVEKRDELFNLLNNVYEIIKEYNFRQLHFHMPNGDSFLRFHSPKTYGDNLFEIRESIRIVNEEKKYISGFEEGRIFNGYRYVYPLSYEDKHIGSVEISLSMASVLEKLHKNDENREVGFIIKREVVENIVFEEEQERYGNSYLSDEYLVDKEVLDSINNNDNGLDVFRNADFIKALKKEVGAEIQTNKSFSKTFFYNHKAYLANYYVVKDISDREVGYIFAIEKCDYINELRQDKNLLLFVVFFTFSILIILFLFIKKIEKRIYSLALVDQLTQVYNRSSFYEFAKKNISKRKRNKESISLAMIDIDFFKKVNDTFGHSVGDDTLKQLASLILNTIRTYDVFARYGGEEFVLLLPNVGLKEAELVLERVRKNVEEHIFLGSGKITISIGLVEIKEGENIHDAIKRSDIALYNAKSTGRNKISLSY